ncbi:hypothetical protein A6R68_12069 [Neotoma lepida]|uniref:Uncharacterized protein n=1 Tax=Neotoma lepida TaxID=56216 RepID=A0A1A6H708_NEOLE|nr:hypothetical protein A6R68_12069 [Neotoma lepida]
MAASVRRALAEKAGALGVGMPLAPVETLGSKAAGSISEVMSASLSINGPVQAESLGQKGML